MVEKKFEDAMTELEEIVKKLEEGDVPLDESVELFEKGKELADFCAKKLKGVERRIEKLVERNGKMEAVPFEE
jgi:exodeoxyribonuclease VII small subunit